MLSLLVAETANCGMVTSLQIIIRCGNQNSEGLATISTVNEKARSFMDKVKVGLWCDATIIRLKPIILSDKIWVFVLMAGDFNKKRY